MATSHLIDHDAKPRVDDVSLELELMVLGVPPAFASAAVHAAEIATTGVAGASHLWQRNVDQELFVGLVLAGVAGGVTGAYLLTGLPEALVRPFIALYLAAMSVLILARAAGRSVWRKQPPLPARLARLALTLVGVVVGALSAVNLFGLIR